MLGSAEREREGVRLIIRACDHNPSRSQTDGRTGSLPWHINSATLRFARQKKIIILFI